jgi:hypothetical protein
MLYTEEFWEKEAFSSLKIKNRARKLEPREATILGRLH